jgi:membrane protein
LLSLVPILILAFAVAGYFLGVVNAQYQIIHQLQNLIGNNGARALQALLVAA